MRLAPVSRRDLIKGLRALGWAGPFPGRKHPHMVKAGPNSQSQIRTGK